MQVGRLRLRPWLSSGISSGHLASRWIGWALPLAAAALLCSPAHAVQDCDLNGQSVNPANGNTTAGKTGLMRCRDRESGQVQREQELRDGKFVGIVRFFENGKVSKEHTINEKGNQQGVAREFGKTGQLLREATYEDGSQVGLVRSFYDNGSLRRATFYMLPNSEVAYAEFTRGGQLSALRCGDRAVLAPAADDQRWCGYAGPATVDLFSEAGSLRARASYEGGKRTRLEQFYDNGKLSLQNEVKGDRSIEKRFSKDGIKLAEVTWQVIDKRSQKLSELEFADSGTLQHERHWRDGELILEQTFYLNGQPRSKTEFSRDGERRVSKVSGYFDTGVVSTEGSFVQQGRFSERPIGTQRDFNQRGNVVAESIYDDQGRLTRERRWDDAGSSLSDDEVFADGSRQAYAK